MSAELKRVSVLFTPEELEIIRMVKHQLWDGLGWQMSRHALLKMAVTTGLNEICEKASLNVAEQPA